MEAQPFTLPKRQRTPAVEISTAIDRWRRHDTGRTLGRSACDVWHGLYAEAGFDLDAPLSITAALVGTLYLGKPEGSRAAEDAGRSVLRTLLREGLLHVISRKGGTWNVTLRDPRVASRARGLVRPDPQRTFDSFDREEVDDAPETSGDADRSVVPLRRAERPPPDEGEIAREKGEKSHVKTHVFSRHIDPRKESNNQDSRSSNGSSVTGTRSSADEDLTRRENTRENSPGRDVAAGGPASIGDVLGGALAAIADPLADAPRRHRIVGDTIRFVQERVRDRALRDTPCVRWGHAIADGRIGHDVLSSILVRLENLRQRGELSVAPWIYFVCASKRAFRERGLDWPEPQRRRER